MCAWQHKAIIDIWPIHDQVVSPIFTPLIRRSGLRGMHQNDYDGGNTFDSHCNQQMLSKWKKENRKYPEQSNESEGG